MLNKIGKRTLEFSNDIFVSGYYSVVSKVEGQGPLGKYFDKIVDDSKFGEDSWEKAESKFLKTAINGALNKSKIAEADLLLAGDLQNQCAGSAFGIRDFDIPFIGLYGACSTMAESMLVSSILMASGGFSNIVAATSSHFCSAERQFRFPLEYGGTRPATAQWTVTGAGAVDITNKKNKIKIERVTPGKIIDKGIKDANNMGAAMAPAAADTIITFFEDTNTDFSDYDFVFTGDLGSFGHELLCDLLKSNGYNPLNKLNDCGMMIYDAEKQDMHCGGSGCGCSASVLCGYILRRLEEGSFKKVLFIATGALMSTTLSQQGESIPGIAHLISFSS